ncbi:hypothetical protein Tco_0395074, partial [Tanacetum coccineum]
MKVILLVMFQIARPIGFIKSTYVATSFDSAVHRVHAVSFDVVVFNVAATVSAAAGSPCICCSSSIPAGYVPAGHVLISA